MQGGCEARREEGYNQGQSIDTSDSEQIRFGTTKAASERSTTRSITKAPNTEGKTIHCSTRWTKRDSKSSQRNSKKASG